MTWKRRVLRILLATSLALGAASWATVAPAMAASGAIKGHVTDNNGANLAGICVTAFAPGHAAGGSAVTDSSGNYAIQGLGTDSYQVRFAAIGCPLISGGNWLEQWYANKPDMSSANTVPVTDAQDTNGINAQMQPGGRIQGHVTDNHGSNFPGVCVSAGQESAVTDANGNYVIQRLPTGPYMVQFSLLGSACGGGNWLDQWYNAKSSLATANAVSVTAGQDTNGINAQMQPGGRIQGHVTDAHGASLQGICVGAGEGPTFTATTTDSGGNYTIDRLSSGSYKVSFSSCGTTFGTWLLQFYNHKPDMASADAVSVVAGQDATGIDAQMQPAAPPSNTTASETPGGTAAGTPVAISASNPLGTTSGASAAVASSISLSARTFAAESRGPSATNAKNKGTTVSFKLNRAAIVVFTVERSTQGRRVKHRGRTTCDRRTRVNRKHKRCSVYVALRGSFSRDGVAGTNKFHFTGRLNGKKLLPGGYRLVATPRLGQKSGIATATTFRVVR